MALTKVNAQLVSGAITTNSSNQVSIGSTTLSSNLSVYGAGSGTFSPYNDPLVVQGSDYSLLYVKGTNGISASVYSYNTSNGWYTGTNNSASYRIGYMSSIDSTGITNAKDGTGGLTVNTSGQVIVNDYSIIGATPEKFQVWCTAPIGGYQYGAVIAGNATSYSVYAMRFVNSYVPTVVGYISIGSSSTVYSTSSDYRLKKDIAPMQNALAKVALLKPVTYKWKIDNKESQGFIAHELAEVVPEAVVGTKDAVDADGNPEYQGIDTSFLVATLTAAIQELKAEVDQLKTQLAAK